MSSNLKKIFLLIVAVLIILFLLLIVAPLFLKKDNQDVTVQDNNSQETKRLANLEKEEEMEKEKIVNSLENFVIFYNSYTWGSFSNIESQYNSMSEEMKSNEQQRVEQMKKNIENQSQQYASARASLIDSKFLLYNENEVEMVINFNVESYSGAVVHTGRISIWVDAEGVPFVEGSKSLVVSSNDKRIKISCIRADGKCKVNKIEDFIE